MPITVTRFLPPVCFLLPLLWGQDQTARPSAAPSPQDQQSTTANRGNTSATANRSNPGKRTSNDRLFFLLPNFLTLENASKVPPMTAGEKFRSQLRGSFDPVQFGWYGALAGISQAKNNDPSYGQGTEGYAKRYAQHFADGTIQNFFTNAVFPSILHQDPRYYQLGKGSFFHRAGYAVKRIFVTRSDSGSSQFNCSEICGGAVAASISTYAYHPESSRNVRTVFSVWGSGLGFDALGYGIKEFWPDIRHRLRPAKPNPAPNGSGKP
jgi:hypothetical protein